MEDRFRLLFEKSLDPIVITDDNGCYTDINQAACELFGYDRDTMLAMSVADLQTPAAPEAGDQFRSYLISGSEAGEFEFLRPDGELRLVSYSACRVAPDQHVSNLRDITKQRAEQERARQETEFTRTCLDSLPGIFYVIDADGRFVRWNQNLQRVSGYSNDEIAVMHPTEFFAGPDRQLIADRIHEAFEVGHVTAEAEFVTRSGKRLPFFFTGQRTDLDGKPCIVGMGIDVAERHLLYRQLHEETETVGTIHRIGQVLSAELDLEKVVQATTDAATELTGANFGAFFYNVVNTAGEAYMLYTISGVPREQFSRFPMPRNTPVFAPTFAGEKTVRLKNVREDSRYGSMEPYNGMPPGHLPVVSYLAVPVISRSGAVLGGLFFGHSDPGVFTERHERIVEGLAAQAAIAIDNAHLFRAEQERSDQLRLAISEVHHRVKNSLQSVGALLEMQLPDDGATMPVEAVLDSLSQIKTIALVHDLLARDKPIGSVDAAIVLRNLGDLLSAGMSTGHEPKQINVEAQTVEMSTRTATSLALAVNELLTNAAKHQGNGTAAPGRGPVGSDIEVCMWQQADTVHVTVQNMGSHFPPNFDPTSHSGIGQQLVQTLVAHDLRGRVRFSNVMEPDQPDEAMEALVEIEFPISVCIDE